MGSGTARLALLRFAAWRLVEKKGGMVAVAGERGIFFRFGGDVDEEGALGIFSMLLPERAGSL